MTPPLLIDCRSRNYYDESMDIGKRILPPFLTGMLIAVPVVFSIMDPLHMDRPEHDEPHGIYTVVRSTSTGSGSVTITPPTGSLTLEGYQGEARVSE